MAKYVTDEFRNALIKRAYQFCNGENDCSINPEIALAYLDAAEVLGADPNKGNITINDIRKEAKTKLSSVEDKNAFWKDEPQDEGFADQLGSLGINICGGLSGYERDEKVGKTLMIAAATAGYNDYNMIGRVAGIYTGTFAFADRDLADLWNQREKSYIAAEKLRAEERRARERYRVPQDPKEKSKPFTAMKSSMLSSQERESEIREKIQEFAEKSLSMDPTDFSEALDGISDKETECLIEIYEGYRSDPSKKAQEFTVALNATLASQKRHAEAHKSFEKASPSRDECDSRTFTKKSEWIKWKKKKTPAKTKQEYEEAYERAKASFEKARDKADDTRRKASKQEDRMCESFGRLSPIDQLRVLDSLSRASTDMLCRESSKLFAAWFRRFALNDTFDKLVNIHAKQIGQSPDSVKRSVNECLGGWPPRIPKAYRNGEIKKVPQPYPVQAQVQQPNKQKKSRH